MSLAAGGRRAGPAVTIEAMLAARERRVARRRDAFARRPEVPLVTVSVVMPGPVKDCALSRDAAAAARTALDRLFAAHGWPATTLVEAAGPTGPEALVAVAAEPRALKRALVMLEETDPLGRLWDLDVAAPGDRAISRRDLGLAPRRCLVCDAPAHACARSRAHPLDALLTAMEERIDAWQARAVDPAA
ncbi:citrate lyase holo-[acyl-carrier protein] synthase [Rhodoplanes sp. TEM]|uniref:citrate lyase holo-[acyl-carrier protein] synthase n=1 Tax=Rhodoplanes tepidamans TaxID=200616 RepID=A0ABT5J5Z7_RHOTP|nr:MULTISPECIES: citrate lyase holo-[acyl-carrier protein] synthase [Rhodoplanes]MDC7785064.1 citrate lyase holo-[acyl-carrier protein] synthase [Rhodoplanes tepidamans]MDC7982538.1 citrate lyase holo-[acyl-carrier protein] synthase [Rhodoplanes sp. TEM]MDQ0356553.1 holo-ACP synthase [Rhodoplanes tepidamans]